MLLKICQAYRPAAQGSARPHGPLRVLPGGAERERTQHLVAAAGETITAFVTWYAIRDKAQQRQRASN